MGCDESMFKEDRRYPTIELDPAKLTMPIKEENEDAYTSSSNESDYLTEEDEEDKVEESKYNGNQVENGKKEEDYVENSVTLEIVESQRSKVKEVMKVQEETKEQNIFGVPVNNLKNSDKKEQTIAVENPIKQEIKNGSGTPRFDKNKKVTFFLKENKHEEEDKLICTSFTKEIKMFINGTFETFTPDLVSETAI